MMPTNSSRTEINQKPVVSQIYTSSATLCRFLNAPIGIFKLSVNQNNKIFNWRANSNSTRDMNKFFKGDTLLHIAVRAIETTGTIQAVFEKIFILINKAVENCENNFLNELDKNGKAFYNIKELDFFNRSLIQNFIDHAYKNAFSKTDISIVDTANEIQKINNDIKFQFINIPPKSIIQMALKLFNDIYSLNKPQVFNDACSLRSSGDFQYPNSTVVLCRKGDTILHVFQRLYNVLSDLKNEQQAINCKEYFTQVLRKTKKCYSKQFCEVRNDDNKTYAELFPYGNTKPLNKKFQSEKLVQNLIDEKKKADLIDISHLDNLTNVDTSITSSRNSHKENSPI